MIQPNTPQSSTQSTNPPDSPNSPHSQKATPTQNKPTNPTPRKSSQSKIVQDKIPPKATKTTQTMLPKTQAKATTKTNHTKVKRLSLLGKCAFFALAVIVLGAVFLPFFAPYSPDFMDLDSILSPASSAHILGTDHLGRDIYTRLIFGARLSLGSVAIILALVLALGIGIGSACALYGGRVDSVVMRVCDMFLSMPTAVLSLLFIAALGVGLANVIIAIALTHWAWYARLVHSLCLSLKSKEFVALFAVQGASKWQSYKANMLTPIASQCLVLATMDIGHFMLHIAGLSFLGLGVQAPQAEWGVMLSEGKEYMWSNAELLLYPGLALFVCVAVCNVLGDSLRDYFDVNVWESK
ncbi:nickel ABC transporter permease subunit NikC [Helicobacter macacae]|uniref:ABC transmembrane type-1 domain-containing protein n=1 Tax=Helicobacter macacae MIT 99-5501 TaxID=1357400 RepID=V8CCL8_9HELI|nr:nickel ABC transporter permease subunit NikC [Helicobacter macacae]ETD24770.1 hypothetical protein HMPREF2086_00104 [Helicobacter macacae MIT 99-5501]